MCFLLSTLHCLLIFGLLEAIVVA